MTAVLRNRHFAVLAACCAALALVVTACGSSSSSSSGVPSDAVAVVNGQPVSKTEFDALLQEYFTGTFKANKQPIPSKGSPAYTASVQKVMSYLVQKTELEQEAKKNGVVVTPKDIDNGIKKDILQFFKGSRAKLLEAMKKQGVSMAEFRQTVAFSVLQTKLVAKLTANDKISDKQALAYYNQNKKTQFTKAPQRLIEHILVKTKAQAQSLYDQIQKGASFAALAKKYSTDTSSGKQGGKLGLQAENALVKPFAKVAFALPTNVLSKPVHSQFGWHLIQAYGPVIPAFVTPFSKAKGTIVAGLLQTKKTDTMSNFQKQMTTFYDTRVKYASGYAPPATTQAPTTTSVIPGG
jgi:foldase protein PrsA